MLIYKLLPIYNIQPTNYDKFIKCKYSKHTKLKNKY